MLRASIRRSKSIVGGAGQEVAGVPFLFKVETFMCENFNRVFVYMLREFLKQTDPKTIRGVSKERMLMQKKPTPTDFQKYSVQRWAISELITAILANPCNSAEDTAYRLALTFYKCAYAAVDSRMYEVFHIAAEFVDKEVIGLFRNNRGIYP